MADYFVQAQVPLSITRADDPAHSLVEVNDAFCALTGYRRDDVLGCNCRFLQRHLSHQPAVGKLRRFMTGEDRRVRVQVINFRADGTPFVNMLTLTRITGSGGTVRFILGTQFDVTAAAPDELLSYDQSLKAVARAAPSAMQRDLVLGTTQSMGEAAASITQARLLIEEAESAGLLT